MDYNNVKELIGIINNSALADFEYKQVDFYVRMSKNAGNTAGSNATASQSVAPSPVQAQQTQQAIIPTEISEPITLMPQEKVEVKEGNLVKAPIVGTFYQSSNPDKPAIVKVGDKVKEGDLLCIIEAMKIMNEIKSPYTGEVAEILVSNEDMVEYDQPLFRIV